MLETYEQEVIRKRRAARIFWFLVFSFATFLYFFFQGYYPALDITWKQVFSSGGMRELTREELIRSFGIINIRIYPRNAIIGVNGEVFGFDEKKMVPYGKYRLSVGKPGYIQDRVRFSIDKKTPYFISEIHLIPQANYTKIGSGELEVSKVDATRWIAKEWRTHILYDKYFSTWSRIPPSGESIGSGYFLSGATLYRFGDTEWEKKSWSGSLDLIKKCKATPQVEFWYLWCSTSWDALSSEWFLYKGVTSIHESYLLGKNTLFANRESFSLNEQERINRIFIENEGTWYTPNGGLLIPIVSNTDKTSVPLIETSLDSITEITTLEGNIVVFGKKWTDTLMVFLKNSEKILIPFPSIALDGLEISKTNGNIFIKTNGALLFLYDGSEKIEWLTEWEILAYSDVSALYKKASELWRVSWEDRE